MTWSRHAAWLGAAAVLAGCASVPRDIDVHASDALAGRLSVRVDGSNGAAPRAVSAGFELQGNAEAGRLNLATPLGTLLAQARWAPGQVVLVTPHGETRFADLDALTREALGESLPVPALFDWLRGRPWPDASSAPTVAPAEPGFTQLGWTVSLAHFDEAVVTARRERPPAVTVRAKIDPP